jgi:hypothetical protein
MRLPLTTSLIAIAILSTAHAAELDWRLFDVRGPDGAPISSAADNRLETAWTSTGGQTPGMAITIDLAVTGMIQRVYLTPGDAISHFPRALRLSAGPDEQHLTPILETNLPTRVHTDLRFPPVHARVLRLELIGEGAGYPWSIAELALFGNLAPNSWPPHDAVILPPDASEPLLRAAADLAYYTTELTGRAVPILTPDAATNVTGLLLRLETPSIPNTYTNYLASDAFRHPERFTVSQQGRDIHFRGETPLAVLYGAYEFLHAHGVRWLLPDALGDAVPAGSGLNLGLLPLQGEPAFAQRYANWNAEQQQRNPDEYAWYFRNRWNRTWAGALNARPGIPTPTAVPDFGYTHTFSTLIPAELFDTHRDWFPTLKDPAWIPRIGVHNLGRRISTDTTWGLNFCTSSPEVADYIAGLIRERTTPPSAHAIAWLTPMDAGSFCECRACRRLDAPRQPPPPYWKTPFALSNRYWSFLTEVARRIGPHTPDIRVGGFAYEGFVPPPAKFPKLPDNLVVDVVQYGAYNLPLRAPTNAAMRAYLEDWGTRWTDPGHLGIYDWALLTGGAGGWPIPLVSALCDRIPTFHRLGARRIGTQADSSPDVWRANPWNFYAYSRLAWNPAEPANQILQDFADGYYRECAAPMLDYYRTWEDYLTNNNIALGDDCRYVPPATVPAEVISAMSRHLATAANSAEHWLTRQRVAEAAAGFHVLTTTVPIAPSPNH